MAGGRFAEHVMCMVCLGDDRKLTKATRIYEGDEDDRYRCELGHEFGMDWRKGPATEPQWPPPHDLVEALSRPASS